MSIPTSAPDPMASQLAQLLTRSDIHELEEIVRRWLKEAPTQNARKKYELFGAKLIELKHALSEQPVQPTHEELELALTMMLRLAAQSGGSPFTP